MKGDLLLGCLSPWDRYWAMLRERELIRYRRSIGCSRDAWTDNAILREYRFCNVFREDDTVTRWINDHIRIPMRDHPELVTALSLARWINLPATLQELQNRGAWWGPNRQTFTDPAFRDAVVTVIEPRVARGETAYTGAYMIRAESNPKQPWYSWPKSKYITDVVVLPTTNMIHFPRPSIERVTEALAKLYGWGGFMAYEVATDLAHTPVLSMADDLDTWANAGPGAKRGLNRIHGRPLTANADFLSEMRELFQHRPAWTDALHRKFRMREIEHGLCEFDKYERVRLGEGKPRSKFRPAGETR